MKRKYVLVDTVSQFRVTYCIPTDLLQQKNPDGKFDAVEWAKDSVTVEEVNEFSQEHIGETIVSARVVDQEEMLEVFDRDNNYLSGWPDEQKIEWVEKNWEKEE